MIKLTLVNNNGTAEIDENAITLCKTASEDNSVFHSQICLNNGSTLIVLENIFDVMQQIVNKTFEGGNANG